MGLSFGELIGLGTPVVVAGATYGFFHWIDEKASDNAKSAIAGWFKPLAYDRPAVASALLELFDRIYGHPLFSWNAFMRSSVISLTLTIAYAVLYTPLVSDLRHVTANFWLVLVGVTAAPLIFNVLTDYVSLFVVRRWLQFKDRSQLFILVTGALAGIAVILSFFILREFVEIIYLSFLSGMKLSELLFHYAYVEFQRVKNMSHLSEFLLLPALATHFWLPLLAVAVAIVKAINFFLWSVGKMQWFLKQGHEHPLEAIGYVAAGIVFCIAAAAQWLWG
jgi:hypothetical protein